METVENKKKGLSIHPRAWPTWGNGRTKNTCASNKKTSRTLKKVQDRYDVRLRDHAATLKTVPLRFQGGFKKPGSRNPSKLRQR